MVTMFHTRPITPDREADRDATIFWVIMATLFSLLILALCKIGCLIYKHRNDEGMIRVFIRTKNGLRTLYRHSDGDAARSLSPDEERLIEFNDDDEPNESYV